MENKIEKINELKVAAYDKSQKFGLLQAELQKLQNEINEIATEITKLENQSLAKQSSA